MLLLKENQKQVNAKNAAATALLSSNTYTITHGTDHTTYIDGNNHSGQERGDHDNRGYNNGGRDRNNRNRGRNNDNDNSNNDSNNRSSSGRNNKTPAGQSWAFNPWTGAAQGWSQPWNAPWCPSAAPCPSTLSRTHQPTSSHAYPAFAPTAPIYYSLTTSTTTTPTWDQSGLVHTFNNMAPSQT